jgi:hypothetical protein
MISSKKQAYIKKMYPQRLSVNMDETMEYAIRFLAFAQNRRLSDIMREILQQGTDERQFFLSNHKGDLPTLTMLRELQKKDK